MLRTNFDRRDLPKYKKAIIEYKIKTNSDRLRIEDDAYDCYGRLLNDSYSLHDNSSEDLSIFWRIFDNVHIITDKEMYENMQYYMEYCNKNEYVTPMDWVLKHKHF